MAEDEYLYLPTEMFMDRECEERLFDFEDIYLERYKPDYEDMLFRSVNYPYTQQSFPVEFLTDQNLRWRWRHLLAQYNLGKRKLYVDTQCLVPALKKKVRFVNVQEEDEEVEDCPICAENLQQRGSRVDVEACGHSFHANCIKKWIFKSGRCPICRGNALKKTPNRRPSELCKLLVSISKEEPENIC